MKHKAIVRALPLLFALALTACKPQGAPDTAADLAALKAAGENWVTQYNDKNADGVAAIYSEQGKLLPPGGPAVEGAAAIKEYWANDIATQWAKISILQEETTVSGDWAWREGAFSVEAAGVTGKFAELWIRTPQGWKLHRDIWNANASPPPPPEATPAAAPAAG